LACVFAQIFPSSYGAVFRWKSTFIPAPLFLAYIREEILFFLCSPPSYRVFGHFGLAFGTWRLSVSEIQIFLRKLFSRKRLLRLENLSQQTFLKKPLLGLGKNLQLFGVKNLRFFSSKIRDFLRQNVRNTRIVLRQNKFRPRNCILPTNENPAPHQNQKTEKKFVSPQFLILVGCGVFGRATAIPRAELILADHDTRSPETT